ncbi:MAG: osmotically inducible protein C [Parvularcula sp.]|uniref:OsmC family protein n=1 Tax=Hyphococcus sp. TaxID=2038636 RepID=UPI000C359841|nr:osmotically inducible protein C [Parvularcula sp.]
MLETPKTETLNGLHVTEIKELIGAVEDNAAAGASRWTVSSEWRGRTHNRSKVKSCTLGGEEIRRDFTIDIDEPEELGGANAFANPQEYMLAALNSCLMVGYVALCSLQGIRIDSLEIETTGDIDLRGFFGLSDKVAPGHESLIAVVRISGDATPQQFAEIHEAVMKTSANYHNIARPVRIKDRLQIV